MTHYFIAYGYILSSIVVMSGIKIQSKTCPKEAMSVYLHLFGTIWSMGGSGIRRQPLQFSITGVAEIQTWNPLRNGSNPLACYVRDGNPVTSVTVILAPIKGIILYGLCYCISRTINQEKHKWEGWNILSHGEKRTILQFS